MKLYQELAEYYFSIEKENRRIDDDIKFISSLISDSDKPALLDLGCGTGEHLAGLSKLGIDCTGIDASKSMIRIAKLRFPGSARFINETIESFSYNQEFDIIISLFGSMDYLLDDKNINAALQNTEKALKPGGIGVFELWNAYPILKIKEKTLNRVSRTNHKGKLIERQRGFKLLDHTDKTIVEVNYLYKLPGKEILKDRHIMRAFTREEIINYLEKNGFDVLACYSNSGMQPYKNTSNKMILHFKKR
ncbi:MAG: methyltransferase domain-containing protein [Spirochaetes bacterium]|nr:methyltransferase domain-containing protein [Spirochaetota bacterium]